MTIMQGIRFYHAALGLLVIAAFLTGEAGLLHLVLGYAIAVILVGRLVAVLSGIRTLGLSRFYPQFVGLRLDNAFTHPAISRTLLAAIAACLLTATATGIALDRGPAAGLAGTSVIGAARADDKHEPRGRGDTAERGDSAMGEFHDGVSNPLMLLVGLHVGYLLLFKRPLARFMLFLSTPSAAPKPPVAP